MALVAAVLTGGISLSLWLVLLLLERLVTKQTRLQQETLEATVRVAERLLYPMSSVESPVTETVVEMDLTEPEDLPVWAMGMTREDLEEGIDPVTGRPLEW